MKWKSIKTFDKKSKKAVLIRVEASNKAFTALAKYKFDKLGFSWYICDGCQNDECGPWNESCVNWWYPVELPRGYEDA